MLNKFFYTLAALTVLVIVLNVILYKSDNCDDRIFLFESNFDEEPSLDEIVKNAADCLYEQRAVFTEPQINNRLIKRVLNIEVNDFFGTILQKSYDLYLKAFFTNNYFPYGGIILYDYNFSEDFEADYKFINNLKSKKTRKLQFYNSKFDSFYEVSIEPYLFSDCVPFNVPHVYCRGVDIDSTSASNKVIDDDYGDIANDYLKYIKFYGDLGIDSALGPVVDINKSSSHDSLLSMTEYAKTVSLLMHQEGFIPVLKHFSYDNSYGDSHNIFTVNEISLNELQKVLMPYKKVDELNIPYMIMTTHQAISSLDKVNPSTQSSKVYAYIKSEYPNSIVIADSISMKGMKGKNYYEKMINGHADNFIIHIGIYFPMINMYHSRKALEYMSQNKTPILRVLKNKQMYNKIKFKKIIKEN